MKPRNDVVEMFASFLQFKESSAVWVSQLKLRRSMEKCLTSYASPPKESNFWALYWHQIWYKQPQTIAKEHLYAYLQETGYHAAYSESQRLDTSKRWDKLQEYFQMGFKNQVYDRVLNKFDPQYGSTLTAFALPLFKTSIKEELRKDNKAASHSNWSLLRHSSAKLWEKALQTSGLSAQEIESYLLLRDCYKSLYITSKNKANQTLSAPDAQTLEAITQIYNQEKLSQLSKPSAELNSKDIYRKLEEAASAIRYYQNPSGISLNTPLGSEGGELKDILSNHESQSLLDNLIAQQEQIAISKFQLEINSILEKTLQKNVKSRQKQYLQLFYGQGLTQQEIAEQVLGDTKKQCNVSRQIKTSSEKLLNALLIWANKQKTHNLEIDNIVDILNIYLKEWLRKYYKNTLN